MTKPTSYRQLTSHQVNPANDTLKIEVLDQPGSGGACHAYQVTGASCAKHPFMLQVLRQQVGEGPSDKQLMDALKVQEGEDHSSLILFQNGPIAEAGVNGITHEVLLAILIDRLQSFQAGQFACRENAIALTKLEEAQLWLQKRTRDRMARGVEGTHEK